MIALRKLIQVQERREINKDVCIVLINYNKKYQNVEQEAIDVLMLEMDGRNYRALDCYLSAVTTFILFCQQFRRTGQFC